MPGEIVTPREKYNQMNGLPTDNQGAISSGIGTEDLDRLYWSKFGRGMPGQVFDRVKTDGNFRNEMYSYLQKPLDELYNVSPEEANKLINWNMISEAEYTKRRGIADTANATNKELSDSITNALNNKYITQDEANRLIGASKSDPNSVREYISRAIDRVLNPVTPYTYNEPEYLKQAKAQLQLDLAAPDTLSTDMVKKWQPYFEQLSAPEIQKELDTIGQTMNSKGRLFSGQTLNKESDLRTSYDQSNLSNALNLGLQEWNQNQAKRTGAQSKAMQLAAFEEGVNQYANDKEANQAMQEMMRNWSNIDTANKTSFDLSNIYRNNAKEESDYNKQIQMLNSYLNASKPDSGGFDWTKLLQPAAQIGAAYITKGAVK